MSTCRYKPLRLTLSDAMRTDVTAQRTALVNPMAYAVGLVVVGFFDVIARAFDENQCTGLCRRDPRHPPLYWGEPMPVRYLGDVTCAPVMARAEHAP